MSILPIHVVVVCIVLAITYQDVRATCWGEASKFENQYGKKVYYCDYKGLQFLPGSKWTNKIQCERCTCSKAGLSCCSIGASSIRFHQTNDKCKNVRVACKVRWVKIDNTNKRCPTEWMPSNLSAVGK